MPDLKQRCNAARQAAKERRLIHHLTKTRPWAIVLLRAHPTILPTPRHRWRKQSNVSGCVTKQIEHLKSFGCDLNTIIPVHVVLFLWLTLGIAGVLESLSSVCFGQEGDTAELRFPLDILFTNPLVVP